MRERKAPQRQVLFSRGWMPATVTGTGTSSCRRLAGRAGERRLGLPRRGPFGKG
jgi:hypothetical protein